jgi:hypothetical protein
MGDSDSASEAEKDCMLLAVALGPGLSYKLQSLTGYLFHQGLHTIMFVAMRVLSIVQVLGANDRAVNGAVLPSMFEIAGLLRGTCSLRAFRPCNGSVLNLRKPVTVCRRLTVSVSVRPF